jgi:FAD/FMN-containing dehydrogenase
MRVRSGFYNEFNDDIIEAALAFVNNGPMSMNTLQVRPIGNGAMQRVSSEATAFSHRGANFLLTIIDHWHEQSEDPENVNWVDSFWQAIAPYRHGNYSNFLQAEGEPRIREAYSTDTFERLARLKLKYDPTNLFSGNENIAPKPLSAVA